MITEVITLQVNMFLYTTFIVFSPSCLSKCFQDYQQDHGPAIVELTDAQLLSYFHLPNYFRFDLFDKTVSTRQSWNVTRVDVINQKVIPFRPSRGL